MTAQESAKEAGKAAGTAGEDTLAAYFGALAKRERVRATKWTWISAVAVVMTIAAAWCLLNAGDPWSTQLAHLAIVVPVLAAGVYASKVAGDHRNHAWLAELRSTQLHTFGAFTAPLPDTAQAELRTSFGRSLFSEHTTDPEHSIAPLGIAADCQLPL